MRIPTPPPRAALCSHDLLAPWSHAIEINSQLKSASLESAEDSCFGSCPPGETQRIRHCPAEASTHERQRHPPSESDDFVQPGSVSAEEMASPQQPRPDHPPPRRKNLPRRTPLGRRLNHRRTQRLTIARRTLYRVRSVAVKRLQFADAQHRDNCPGSGVANLVTRTRR